MSGQKPYAVVDIGSNSVRLVVYQHFSRAPVQSFNEKSMCELGRGVARDGSLDQDAISQTLEALERYRALADAMGIEQVDAFATAAVREASNSQVFLDKAKAVLGNPVSLLSGHDEALAAIAGVRCGFDQPKGLVADLGGGSLEIGTTLEEKPEWMTSISLGVLSLAERSGRSHSKAMDIARSEIEAIKWVREAANNHPLYAVGGSWRAIARAHMIRTDWPLNVAHHYRMQRKRCLAFLDEIIEGSKNSDYKLEGAPRKRQDTLGYAAIVLRQLLISAQSDEVIISATGVREGRLFSAIDKRTKAQDPLIHAARGWGRNANREHSLGKALDDFTQKLHHDTMVPDRIRSAACHVSDIAWRDHPDNRGRLAFSRLVQFPFVGISHEERIALALSVHYRYGGVNSNVFAKPLIAILSDELRLWSETQGRAMQLAYRFSGGVPSLIKGASLSVDRDRLTLRLPPDHAIAKGDAVQQRLTKLTHVLGLSMALIDQSG